MTLPVRKLRVGILGFGRIGAEHAQWITECGAAEVAAVCDATESRLQLARKLLPDGARCVSTLEQLLDTGGVDAILIATPSAMHYEQATLALRAGRHVMVEKPMALHFEDALKLCGLAEAQQRQLGVFHNRRWDEDYLRVRQLVQAGTLGRLLNVESRLHQYASCIGPAAREYRPNWRNEAAFGGGGLYDWGSHFVDQLWQLMLPRLPLRVFAQLRGNVWSRDCDDFARVLVDFDDGAVGLLEINCTTARPLPRWHLDGTAGSADSPSDLGFDTRTWASLSVTPAPNAPVLTLPREVPEQMTPADLWRAFARTALEGTAPAIYCRSVLPTMLLLDAAQQSSRSGAAVAVAEQFRALVG
jgi:predicted dehydrogenase